MITIHRLAILKLKPESSRFHSAQLHVLQGQDLAVGRKCRRELKHQDGRCVWLAPRTSLNKTRAVRTPEGGRRCSEATSVLNHVWLEFNRERTIRHVCMGRFPPNIRHAARGSNKASEACVVRTCYGDVWVEFSDLQRRLSGWFFAGAWLFNMFAHFALVRSCHAQTDAHG
jgi:hypothetical protein